MGGSSGKKGGGEFEVTDYYMSMHVGICMGPVDALTGIYVGDKTAWEGEQTTEGGVSINQPNLFGGNKKEGGLRGVAYFMYGKASGIGATLIDALAERLGRTSETAPAFTGFASLWFVGSVVDSSNAFYWSSNSPYLKDLAIRVKRRNGTTANPTFGPGAGEPVNYSDMGDGGQTCNPAHMVYECLINGEWGMGASPAMLDTASFQACAKIFHSENFGLAMMWTRQTTIEAFVTEILDHVQASLFINPLTGLLTLKAIRGDYVLEDLPELNPDNCKITKFSRKSWGETINELTISWTNPANEESESYTIHDLASIEMQGGTVSEGRDYYGVRTATLAAFIASRDIRTAAAPIATFDIQANRTVWGILPGSVYRLSYPEYGIEDLAVRIGKVDRGRPGDSIIKFTALEDIFGLPQAAYTTPTESEWEGGSRDATPLDYTKIITLPSYFAVRVVGQYSSDMPEYPEVVTGVLGATTNYDTRSFELYGEVVQPNGSIVMSNIGTKSVTMRATLTRALSAEITSAVNGADLGLAYATIGSPPTENTFVIIGDGTDRAMEIALIIYMEDDYSAITLERGVLDTTPRAWPLGTPVWFINDTSNSGSNARYADGGVAAFKCLPSTSKGTLAIGSAPLVTQLVNGRPHYPTRPANVKVNGIGFGTVIERTGANLSLTWAQRNRLTEDTQIVLWDDGDITPESGQTTKVQVLNVDRTVIVTHTGLTGTSFTLPRTPFASINAVIVRVTSVRDGLESLQGHEIIVSNGKGWGYDYGNKYGGI